MVAGRDTQLDRFAALAAEVHDGDIRMSRIGPAHLFP
jgi:hypothetical protein